MDMTKTAELLHELTANDGACLYWQMSDPDAALNAVASGDLRMVNDLVIHPEATEIEYGMAYTMDKEEEKEFCQHHRDDGRGHCIDCGVFLPSAHGDYW